MQEAPAAPEIKVSKNPQIQANVEQRKSVIRGKYPEADETLINDQARTRIAAEMAIDRLRAEAKRNKGKAITDNLTGALNSTGFEEMMQLEGRRTIRTGKSMVIVILDANDLKEKNKQGHAVGDEYLVRIANVLRKTSRASDVLGRNSSTDEETPRVARWGGDEFGVILDSTDLEGGKTWWNRTSAELEAAGISIGAGMQVLDPSEIRGKTPGEISVIIAQKKHEADLAMMGIAKPESKARNRPVLTVYNELPQDVITSLPKRIEELSRAA